MEPGAFHHQVQRNVREIGIWALFIGLCVVLCSLFGFAIGTLWLVVEEHDRWTGLYVMCSAALCSAPGLALLASGVPSVRALLGPRELESTLTSLRSQVWFWRLTTILSGATTIAVCTGTCIAPILTALF